MKSRTNNDILANYCHGVVVIANQVLPEIIAGPVLRHVADSEITIWLVTSSPYPCELLIQDESSLIFSDKLSPEQVSVVPVGKHAFVQLINVTLPSPLPQATFLSYDIKLHTAQGVKGLADLIDDIGYQSSLPNFSYQPNINKVLHGSCRKPHFPSEDSIRQIDKSFAQQSNDVSSRPSMLLMTGDQVYVDDVAGPMLVAIHQVITLLGLYDEHWQGAVVNNSQALFESHSCYYHRELMLPRDEVNKAVYDKLFAYSKKPIFTSVNAKNHLVTLSEVIAMYLLVWSPALWQFVDLDYHAISDEFSKTYEQEKQIISEFATGLSEVRRALAHVPVYMIFDDHDITDDWNLTRAWEEAAYNHDFSRRIIGNALIGYWLCQGWGNAPAKFASLIQDKSSYFTDTKVENHDELVNRLLDWDEWHYNLDTFPKVVVLDTRTHRWRSESNAGKPSGLMDWEAMTEMQQALIGEPNIIMVSPAPIYGVKVIEAIQRIFTFFGYPLVVDAENWMAHKGTANVMLNIFQHPKTPPNFVILSGDVHYSFVYEVTHRSRKNTAKILQVTASGIKNEFPPKLISKLDTLNRYLYGESSILNWFTKRRHMKVKVRKPHADSPNTLHNGSGIGQLLLSEDKQEITAELITCKGDVVRFEH